MHPAGKDGRSYGSVRRAAREVFFTNLMLLGFQPAREEAKNRTPFTSDMFAVPNKKAFEVVMYFLLQRLNPSMAKEQFRDCWPVNDRKKEQQFRKAVNSWLTHISTEDSDANLPRIVPSMFLSPGGDKFYHLLLHLSTYVCKKAITDENGLKSREFLQHPKLMPSIIHLGPVLAKTQRAATISHRKKFLEEIQYNGILQKEWREIADGMAKEHRVLKKEVRELERNVEDKWRKNQELNGKLGSPLPMKKKTGGRYDGEMEVQAIKRSQKVQKVRELWARLENFHESHSQHRQIVNSVLGGMANKYKIDATDINFQVPALLMRECERQIHERNAGNTYEEGRLNLLSLMRLSNLSLHLYLEKLQETQMPRFERITPKVATEVHTHHAHLANMRALRSKLANDSIPDLKASIDEIIAELDAEEEAVTSSLPVFPDRTPSSGLGLIPPAPELYAFRPEANVQTPPHLREAWSISGASPMDDTPVAVAKLDDAMTKVAMRRAGLMQGSPVSTRGELRQQLHGESKLPRPATFIRKPGPGSSKKPQDITVSSQRPETYGRTKADVSSRIPKESKKKQTSQEKVWTPPKSERRGTPSTRYRAARSLIEEPPMDNVISSVPRPTSTSKAHDLLAEQIARAVAGDIPQDDLFAVQSPLQSLGLDAFTSKDKISRTPDTKEKDTPQVARTSGYDVTPARLLFHDEVEHTMQEEGEEPETNTEITESVKMSSPTGRYPVESDRPFPGKDRTLFSDNENDAVLSTAPGHTMHLDLPESDDSIQDEQEIPDIQSVEESIEGLQKIGTLDEMFTSKTPSLPVRSRKANIPSESIKSISPLLGETEDGEGLASVTPPLSMLIDDDSYSLTPRIKRDKKEISEDTGVEHQPEETHVHPLIDSQYSGNGVSVPVDYREPETSLLKSPEVCEPESEQGRHDSNSETKELVARLNKLKALKGQQTQEYDHDTDESLAETLSSKLRIESLSSEPDKSPQKMNPVLSDKYLTKSPLPKSNGHKPREVFSLDLDDMDLEFEDVTSTSSPEVGISDIPVTLVDVSPDGTPSQTPKQQKAHMSLMSAHMKAQSGHGIETEVLITPPGSRDLSPRQRVGARPIVSMQEQLESEIQQEIEEQTEPLVDIQGEPILVQRSPRSSKSENDSDTPTDRSSTPVSQSLNKQMTPCLSQSASPVPAEEETAMEQPSSQHTITSEGESLHQTSPGEESVKPSKDGSAKSSYSDSPRSEADGEPSKKHSSSSSSSSSHSPPPQQTVHEHATQVTHLEKPSSGQASPFSKHSTSSEHTPSERLSPTQSQEEKYSDVSQHESPRSPPPTPEDMSSSKNGSKDSSGSRSPGQTSSHKLSSSRTQDSIIKEQAELKSKLESLTSSTQEKSSSTQGSLHSSHSQSPTVMEKEGTSTPNGLAKQESMDKSQNESQSVTADKDMKDQQDVMQTSMEDSKPLDDTSPMTPPRPTVHGDEKTDSYHATVTSELDIFGLGDESVLIPPSPLPDEDTRHAVTDRDGSSSPGHDPPNIGQL